MACSTRHDSRYFIYKFFDEETVEKLVKWAEEKYSLQNGLATMLNPYANDKKNTKLKALTKNNEEAIIPPGDFLNKVDDMLGLEWEAWTVPKGTSSFLFSVYNKGGFYKPHFDSNTSGHFSQTIFLSDPDSYEGGELQLYINGEVKPFKLKPGYGVVYETGIPHCVTEVTQGTRKAFCFWTFSQIPVYEDLYKYREYQSKTWDLIPGYKLGTPTYPIDADDIAKSLEDFVSKEKVHFINKASDIVRKYI